MRESRRERNPDLDRDDRYEDRRDAPIPRPVARERREDRRDYYDDRRDFARGATYTAVWWGQSCSNATVVVVDDYSYYECNDAWFSRTYYGGEVIYTVTDAPSGY